MEVKKSKKSMHEQRLNKNKSQKGKNKFKKNIIKK